MKKGILFFIMLLVSFSLFATEYSVDFLGYWSYETNMFSNPLPKNGGNDFLENKVENPYYKRTDAGGKINLNMFFIPESRAGLTFSFSFGYPLTAIESVPVKEDESVSFDDGPWHYEERNALSSQKGRISLGVGGIFRYYNSFVEIGSSIRAVISTFDYFRTFNIGVEAEPFFKLYFRDFFYVGVGASFTAHIFHFIFSVDQFYEKGYSAISVTPYVGFGIRFGA